MLHQGQAWSVEAHRLAGGFQHGHPEITVRVGLVAFADRQRHREMHESPGATGRTTISVRPDIAACTAAGTIRTAGERDTPAQGAR